MSISVQIVTDDSVVVHRCNQGQSEDFHMQVKELKRDINLAEQGTVIISPHVKESKQVVDSGFRRLD